MALLYNPRFVAFDANGDPISGAKLYTYDSVATSTPKETYSDAARTVEHENPVVADTNGVFPQIFGAEGDGYYLVLKDADDVLVDEFLAVQTLGQDASSVFLRDFALNGRLRGYGEAGVVNLEFMPPAGDDTGGDGRIGGAGGTQGEDLEVDFATTTFTGAVELGPSATAPSFSRLVDDGSATASSAIVIALPTETNAYELFLNHIRPTGALLFQFSFDNGATYLESAAAYRTMYNKWDSGSSSAISGTVNDATYIQADDGVGGTNEYASRVQAMILLSSTEDTGISGTAWYVASGACQIFTFGGSTKAGTNGRATHIKVYPNTGTITCHWALRSVPGF